MTFRGQMNDFFGERNSRVLLCTVDKVDDGTIDVSPIDDFYAPISGVRLSADIDNDKRLFVKPKKGSVVIVNMLTRTDGYVAMYSEIDSIIYKDAKGLEVELTEGKIRIKNNNILLGETLRELVDIISRAVITTPSGPGNMDIATQVKLSVVKNKLDTLLL